MSASEDGIGAISPSARRGRAMNESLLSKNSFADLMRDGVLGLTDRLKTQRKQYPKITLRQMKTRLQEIEDELLAAEFENNGERYYELLEEKAHLHLTLTERA